MEKLKVALVQPDTVWEDPAANRNKIENMLAGAGEKSDLALLPETFTTGFSMDSKRLAEEMTGPTVTWMQKLADDTGTAIAGSLIVSEAGHYYNRFVAAVPGGPLQFYDKAHLFALAGEDRSVAPGDSQAILDIHGWKIAPRICYDLRFPAWSRNYGGTYDCLVYVASWPASRASHWKALLTARAIENQAYCLGVNRTGTDGNQVASNGGSLAVDFNGETLVSAGDEEGVLFVTLSRNDLAEYRKQFPWLKDADEPVT